MFVRGGAIAVAISALPALRAVSLPIGVSPGLRKVTAVPEASWARSRFTPFVGATFRLTGGPEDVDAVLAEVRDLSPVLRPADEKRFSLMFSAARNHTPVNGIRTFRHDDFGSIDMFVSPVGPIAQSVRYQVVINRL
jgi:hypothetical protein